MTASEARSRQGDGDGPKKLTLMLDRERGMVSRKLGKTLVVEQKGLDRTRFVGRRRGAPVTSDGCAPSASPEPAGRSAR